jgi:hypothetical protein
VGGQIVAEVLVGLIDGDGQSYRAQDPESTPTYGSNDTFTMVDLLTTAGVIAPLPEFSRVDTSSWGSGADETGDRVGGFADLGVGCGAPFPDGVGDKSRWPTPMANGRSLVIHRRRVVRRVRRMAWRGTRLIENGARAAEGSNAAHVDACGRLRARRPSLALR